MLSILILTHNRPQLFKRALTSVLNNLPDCEIEILVNNDSQDIEELYSDDVHIEYNYFTDTDLSLVYKHLFDRAAEDYVFFLEDDDYINKNFFEGIDFVSDVYYLEYTSNPLINEVGPVCHYKRMTTVNKQAKKETVISSFLQKYDDRDFQLSQLVFRKSIVGRWPTGNDIENDKRLFESFHDGTIKCMSGHRWVQTTDGNDNISFEIH